MKKIIAVFSALVAVFLCACSTSPDYEAQPLKGSVTDEEVLADILSVCECIGYTDSIVCFDDWDDVADSYSQIMLDYLSAKYYAKYSANKQLFSALAEHYPTLSVNTMIPAEDYENSVYTCFGGYERVKHYSLNRYAYLDKINAYLAIGERYEKNTVCTIISCAETKDTYRAVVSYEGFDGRYDILLIKRDSGVPYILKVSSEQ